MDLAGRWLHLRSLIRFPSRARAIRGDSEKRLAHALAELTPAWRRRLAGVALILSSLLLGAWAYDQAAADSLRAWQLKHPPSQKVWTSALRSRGLSPAGAGARFNKASRSLPARLEQEGTTWISGDSSWVAVFATPDSPEPFHLFCSACDTVPARWEAAGRGWQGLERTLEVLDSLPKRAPLRVAKATDPREIRY